MSVIAPVVRRPVQTLPEEHYPEVGIRSFGKGVFHKPVKTGLEIGDKRLFSWCKDDLLFNVVFAWEGAVAVATELEHGKVGSHRFLTCVVDPTLALPRFLFWWFVHDLGRDQLLRASPGGAGRNRTLGVDKLARIEVPLPPLDEQKRIVSRLDGAVALVEERRRAIDAAEHEMQSMLSKAFQVAIDGATLRPMSEVAPLVRRQVKIDAEATYTEIGVRSFYNGIFHRRTVMGSEFSWQDLFWLKEGDLVFSNLMAWEKAIALASAEDEGTVGNHRMLTCEVNPDLATPGFLMAYFRTFEGYSSIVGHSPGTIARNKTLSSKKLPTIQVPVPDMAKQRWFDELEAKANEARAIRARTAMDVEALIPAMLHEIFSGKAVAA
jgi:type I restriction enzyme S subunit